MFHRLFCLMFDLFLYFYYYCYFIGGGAGALILNLLPCERGGRIKKNQNTFLISQLNEGGIVMFCLNLQES